MENCVLMYWSSKFVEKFEIIEWTNHVNSMENQRTYQIVKQHMQHYEHQCSNDGQLTPKIDA